VSDGIEGLFLFAQTKIGLRKEQSLRGVGGQVAKPGLALDVMCYRDSVSNSAHHTARYSAGLLDHGTGRA
jgi:hypothetical protein